MKVMPNCVLAMFVFIASPGLSYANPSINDTIEFLNNSLNSLRSYNIQEIQSESGYYSYSVSRYTVSVYGKRVLIEKIESTHMGDKNNLADKGKILENLSNEFYKKQPYDKTPVLIVGSRNITTIDSSEINEIYVPSYKPSNSPSDGDHLISVQFKCNEGKECIHENVTANGYHMEFMSKTTGVNVFRENQTYNMHLQKAQKILNAFKYLFKIIKENKSDELY